MNLRIKKQGAVVLGTLEFLKIELTVFYLIEEFLTQSLGYVEALQSRYASLKG
jgi:hypothetical protein